MLHISRLVSKFVNGDLAPKARGVVGHSWLLVCGSAINHRPSTTNQSGHQRSTTNHQPNWGERDFWGLSTCPPVAVIRRERGRDRVVEHQFIGLTPFLTPFPFLVRRLVGRFHHPGYLPKRAFASRCAATAVHSLVKSSGVPVLACMCALQVSYTTERDGIPLDMRGSSLLLY